jgi:DNA-binding NarL/FixJ family response regulator
MFGDEANVLTNIEADALGYIHKDSTPDDIVRLQGLSVHTVQSHIKNLYSKLPVHSRSEAVFEATRMGLLSFQ